jgi:hypothetical protein
VKSLTLIGSLFAFASSVGAQGVFVDRGQSGAFVAAGFYAGHGITGGGMDLGYISEGIIDLGASFIASKATMTGFNRWGRLITVTDESYTIAQAVTLYPLRLTLSERNSVIVSLHESLAFHNISSCKFILLGGAVSLRSYASPTLTVVFSAGQSYSDHGYNDVSESGTTSLDLSFAFRRGSRIISVTPSYASSSITSLYGLTVGLSFNTKGKKKTGEILP